MVSIDFLFVMLLLLFCLFVWFWRRLSAASLHLCCCYSETIAAAPVLSQFIRASLCHHTITILFLLLDSAPPASFASMRTFSFCQSVCMGLLLSMACRSVYTEFSKFSVTLKIVSLMCVNKVFYALRQAFFECYYMNSDKIILPLNLGHS